MPEELRQHLAELEKWAVANERDRNHDAIAFWSLKIPAILASASAGTVAYFNLTAVSVFAGFIASICVIIDGVHPRGMLRNTHHLAFSDIRILANNMMVKWRTRNPKDSAEDIARRIILEAEKERRRIAIYIRDAEGALNFKNKA
jgi:uncharacterized membrane protein YgaE (UPF0421/DUF939 family)